MEKGQCRSGPPIYSNIFEKIIYNNIYITILFKFTKCDSYINQLVYHTITITIIYNYSITHDILNLLDEGFAT